MGDAVGKVGATTTQVCGCVKGWALPTTRLPAPAAQGPMSSGRPDVTVRISAWLSNKENNEAANRDTPQLLVLRQGLPCPGSLDPHTLGLLGVSLSRWVG